MGLDTVELVMAFEGEFGIEIPDSAAATMYTPKHVIDYVIQERRKQAAADAQDLGANAPGSHPSRTVDETEVAQQVKAIVLRQLGIRERDYEEDKRFIEDFGAD